MIIGIDYHDTLSYAPDFFRSLCSIFISNGHTIYIVSGTPESYRLDTVKELVDIGFEETKHYKELLLGFEYKKEGMTIDHFKKMREHKLKICLDYKIEVYFDDNPFYVSYLCNHGIVVFETVVSKKYRDDFGKKDPFFTCHLQEKQFDFLNTIQSSEVSK